MTSSSARSRASVGSRTRSRPKHPPSSTPISSPRDPPLYGPVPWRLAGRAFSLLCRVEDPAALRVHVPDVFELDPDPVVRIRFWELAHDGGFGDDDLPPGPPVAVVREAVIAFQVRHGDVEADFPAYMYADDPIYTAFGREAMGWPLRDGRIELSRPWSSTGLDRGAVLTGDLERHGHAQLGVTLRLLGTSTNPGRSATPPSWFVIKTIPDFDAVTPAIRTVALTGPSVFARGALYAAEAAIHVATNPAGDLSWLRPREIVSAEIWTDVELMLGPGRPIFDLATPTARV